MCKYTSYIAVSDKIYVENPQKEEEKLSTETDIGYSPVEGEEIIESENGRLHRRKRVDTDDDIVIKKRRLHKSSESMKDDTKCDAVEEPRKEEEKLSTKTDVGDSPVEGKEQICESVSGRLNRRKRVDTDRFVKFKEKGIKWLKRMESTINWEQIINENISYIDK